ncbi:unnamed protein product [Paramecium octaurelia]|uniref:Uncharacterized protein n=1 Tax=Paramecium octaurelia TaxID=43137 RepID=A0A8S1VU25_PAROT|nr:unnamed protein product [Paramecium octaurelia]
MNLKPDLQGWQEYVQTPYTNQLKQLSDLLNNSQEQQQPKITPNPFNINLAKKCITQQSQSPKYRQHQKLPFNEYRKQMNINRQASPFLRHNQFNFSQDRKQEIHSKFYSNQNQKQSLVIQSPQRSQRKQITRKLLMISKDFNNSQIYHIIKLINK